MFKFRDVVMTDFEVMREALEMSFPDQCRLHDALVSFGVDAFQAGRDKPRGNADTELGLAWGRVGNAVKAIMLVQFPVAARAWHGEDAS